MVDRELEARRHARDVIPDLEEFNDPEDRVEEQYQCSVCKTLCYLSQITCSCTESVSCLEHYDTFCICEEASSRRMTLRTRYTDEEIRIIHRTVTDLTQRPQAWSTQLRELLIANPTPPLKNLRAFLADAESHGAPEDEVDNLASFITRADAWNNHATQILTRRSQPRKRGRKSKGSTAEDAPVEIEYTVDDAEAMLEELKSFSFQSLEVTQLTEAYRASRLLRTRVTSFLELSLDQRALEQGEVLLSDCRDLLLGFPEIISLEQAVELLRLMNELDQVDDTTLTLSYVEDLFERAQAHGMDPDHQYYKLLLSKVELGNEWKKKASEALHSKGKTIDELWAIISPVAGTPTVEKTRNALQTVWSKAKEAEKVAKSILAGTREKKSTPEEVISTLNKSSDCNIPVVDEVKALAKRGARFSSIAKSIIKGTYQGDDEYSLDQLFVNLPIWRTEVTENFSMFNIPAFDEVRNQIGQHETWLKTLPWHKRLSPRHNSSDPFTEAFSVLQDVISHTRTFDHDVPGPECTCICKEPVLIGAGASNAVKCDSCGAKVNFRSV